MASFDDLIGCKLVAANGTYLGIISKDRYDANSIMNEYGNYGSPYSATSIFNQYGTYGGQYSSYSPFNPYTSTPPLIMKSGQKVGFLTANKYLANAIDAHELVGWLKVQS